MATTYTYLVTYTMMLVTRRYNLQYKLVYMHIPVGKVHLEKLQSVHDIHVGLRYHLGIYQQNLVKLRTDCTYVIQCFWHQKSMRNWQPTANKFTNISIIIYTDTSSHPSAHKQ